jgi:hypothetical protein
MDTMRVLTVSIMICFLFINSAIACVADWSPIPFNGLKSVGIYILSLDDDSKKAGFTEEELINSIEIKLRQNGIKGRDINDISESEPSFLYLRLNVMYIKKNAHYVYVIDLSFVQPVRLLRNNRVLIAKTWDQNYLGIELPHGFRNTVEVHLDNLLTQFVDAYLEANPNK